MEDPLDFVYRFCIRPVNTLFVKILASITTIILIVYQILTTKYILDHDVEFFAYIMYLATYFYTLSISAFLWMNGLIAETAAFIRADLMGHRRMRNEKVRLWLAPYRRAMLLHCAVYSVVCICVCVFLIPWSEFMKKYTYMEKVTREYPVMYSFYLTYVAVAYLMYLNSYILPYFMLHTVFQCEILLGVIASLMLRKTDFQLKQNLLYQKNVKNKLRECCMVNANIKRLVRSCVRYTYNIGAVFFTIFCFLIACFLVSLDQATSDSDLVSLMIFTTVIVAIDCFIILYLNAGQLIQDKTCLIFDRLCSCPWYTWDRGNVRIYAILLAHTRRPSRVHTVKDLALTWALLVQCGRIVMNMYLFLKTIKAI